MIERLRLIRVGLFSRGQGLAEYVLILALIAMIAVTAIMFLGGGVERILSATGSKG